MPIGSLTSQFFANVYLNELDQFVKHRLKVRGYLRYVDDFVLLADDAATLVRWQREIEHFLQETLHLQLHPGKTVLQRSAQGIDFLGNIVYPDHRLVRQRSVRALRRRLAWFERLIFGDTAHPAPMPGDGQWRQWLQRHEPLDAPGHPSPALLKRMLATLNSYYGVFAHAHTHRLRKHIYEHELGRLQTFFIPEGPGYRHLRIRKAWWSMP
jgi:RNA-directed DNA polymerase